MLGVKGGAGVLAVTASAAKNQQYARTTKTGSEKAPRAWCNAAGKWLRRRSRRRRRQRAACLRARRGYTRGKRGEPKTNQMQYASERTGGVHNHERTTSRVAVTRFGGNTLAGRQRSNGSFIRR